MKPSNKILLPASDRRWELWKKSGVGYALGESGDTPSDLTSGTEELIVGLPGIHCRTVALGLPEAEGEELDAMVHAQLEKRGLRSAAGDKGTQFTSHQLVRDAGSTIVSVDILDEELPEDYCLNGATAYLPSARLLPLPQGKLIIVPEYGRLLLVAGRGGNLLHSHVIGVGSALPEDAAEEIRTTRMALEARGLSGKISGIELWGDFDRAAADALSQELGLPVNITARPSPSSNPVRDLSEGMLPEAVSDEQGRRARRGRFLRILALAALLYVIGAVAAWVYFRSLKSRAADLEEQVASTAPGAAEVRATSDTWRNMRPAIEPKRYPLIVLNEFTKIMPPGGVVVTEFDTKVERISIEGLAKDAQIAFQLLEDVKKSAMLKAYNWEMGQPRMNENNSARFDIIGKVAN